MSDGKQRGPASRVQQMTHLLDADPALGEVLSAARRSEARAAAVAPVVTLGIGSCDLDALLAGAPAGFGLLVLAGVLACHITVNGLHAIEFAGAGDVLLPGAMPATMIQCTRRWEVLDGARV